MTIEKIKALFENRKFNAVPHSIRYIFHENNFRIASVPEYEGTYHIYNDGGNFYLKVEPKILNDDFLITLKNHEIVLTSRSSNTGVPFVTLTPVHQID